MADKSVLKRNAESKVKEFLQRLVNVSENKIRTIICKKIEYIVLNCWSCDLWIGDPKIKKVFLTKIKDLTIWEV